MNDRVRVYVPPFSVGQKNCSFRLTDIGTSTMPCQDTVQLVLTSHITSEQWRGRTNLVLSCQNNDRTQYIDMTEQMTTCYVMSYMFCSNMTEHNTMTWQNTGQLVLSCHVCFVLTWLNTQYNDMTKQIVMRSVMSCMFSHAEHSTMTRTMIWHYNLFCHTKKLVISCHVRTRHDRHVMYNDMTWQNTRYNDMTCHVMISCI